MNKLSLLVTENRKFEIINKWLTGNEKERKKKKKKDN